MPNRVERSEGPSFLRDCIYLVATARVPYPGTRTVTVPPKLLRPFAGAVIIVKKASDKAGPSRVDHDDTLASGNDPAGLPRKCDGTAGAATGRCSIRTEPLRLRTAEGNHPPRISLVQSGAFSSASLLMIPALHRP